MTGTSAEPCGRDPELGVQLERIDDLERLDAALGQLRAESFPIPLFVPTIALADASG
jgi:hypothetical protein